MRKFIAFILILATTQTALAAGESCPTVNLQDNPILSDVRNQQSLGWCYAFSLSDLIGFRLGRKISPFDLAIGNYEKLYEGGWGSNDEITRLAGGKISKTFDAVKSRGVCLEKKMSAAGDYSTASLAPVEKLAIQVSKLNPDARDFSLQVGRLVSMNAWRLRQVFPTSTLSELVNAFMNLDPTKKPLASLSNAICGHREPIADLEILGGRTSDPDQLIRFLKTGLRTKAPVAVSYSAKTLLDIKYRGPTGHVSTVIGMRKDKTGECEFLVRNSWGRLRVQSYDPSLRSKFSNGNIWVPESLMRVMATEAFYVQKQR